MGRLSNMLALELGVLFLTGEITGLRCLSLHNIAYYLKLTQDIRDAIEAGTFADLLSHHRGLWDK